MTNSLPNAMSEIAQQVRAARADRGWTQMRLAEKAGTSRPSIARLESGEDVSTDTLGKISAALGRKLVLADLNRTSEQ